MSNKSGQKIVKAKSAAELESCGWKIENHHGLRMVNPTDPHCYIREPLIKKLGNYVRVTKWGNEDSYLDIESGYIWPAECLGFKKMQASSGACECGARFTSFPNHHLSYCGAASPSP